MDSGFRQRTSTALCVVVLLALPLLPMAMPIRAYAWGGEGHRIVARLAAVRLTPAARSGVANLLDEGETLADAATWADEIKNRRPETKPWHFVDIPRADASYNADRDCSDPNPGDCIVTQTERFRQTLTDPGATGRTEALRFVVHFVGDLHQPLHCATDVGPDRIRHTDDGGNLKHICFFGSCTVGRRSRDLHSAWDTYIIEREHPNEDEYVATLQARIQQLSSDEISRIEQGTLREWAEASHQLAVTHAYGDLPDSDSGVFRLAGAYETANAPIIDQQLEAAGIRLAHILNASFDPGTPPHPEASPTPALPTPASPPAPAMCGTGKALRVHFYNVAQALAVLVDLPGGQHVLFDTGDAPNRPGCAQAVCGRAHQHLLDTLANDLNGDSIAMLWISHQHSDHIGGAPGVLRQFTIQEYVDNGRDTDKGTIQAAHVAAEAAHTNLHIVDPQHQTVPITVAAPVKITAILPSTWPDDCDSDPNECSIGLRFDYCNSSVLLTGDAEDGEESLLDTHGPATLLQLAHHGSDTSSSDAFIQQVSARYAVISAGKPGEGLNTTYCHPRQSTVERVNAKLGGSNMGSLKAFDAAVACRNAAATHWKTVPTSSHLWATERDGDVVLTTMGDGAFTRE